MVNQKHRAQHAALCDPGQGMNIVHSEGLKGGGQKRNDAVGWLELWKVDIHFLGATPLFPVSGHDTM